MVVGSWPFGVLCSTSVEQGTPNDSTSPSAIRWVGGAGGIYSPWLQLYVEAVGYGFNCPQKVLERMVFGEGSWVLDDGLVCCAGSRFFSSSFLFLSCLFYQRAASAVRNRTFMIASISIDRKLLANYTKNLARIQECDFVAYGRVDYTVFP